MSLISICVKHLHFINQFISGKITLFDICTLNANYPHPPNRRVKKIVIGSVCRSV